MYIFELDDGLFIPRTITALKRQCRKNKIKIKRAPFTLWSYVFYPDDLFGIGRAEIIASRNVFGKITCLDVKYCDLLRGKKTVANSFIQVNGALISRFGSPDESGGSIAGDDIYSVWYLDGDGVKIRHSIFERFGSMEYLRFEFLR